jgi:hypothetical protein
MDLVFPSPPVHSFTSAQKDSCYNWWAYMDPTVTPCTVYTGVHSGVGTVWSLDNDMYPASLFFLFIRTYSFFQWRQILRSWKSHKERMVNRNTLPCESMSGLSEVAQGTLLPFHHSNSLTSCQTAWSSLVWLLVLKMGRKLRYFSWPSQHEIHL